MYNRKKIIVDLLNKSNNINDFINLLNKEFTKEEKIISLKPITINLTSAFIKSKTVKELKENIEDKLRKEAGKLINNPSEEFIEKLKGLKLRVLIRDEWVGLNNKVYTKFEEAYLAKKLFKFKIDDRSLSKVFYENDTTIQTVLNLIDDYDMFELKENTPINILVKQLIKTKNGSYISRFKKATSGQIRILAIEENYDISVRYKFFRETKILEKIFE